MRRVMVRVLPVPAPASTHTGPRGACTASRCSSSRSFRRAATGASSGMASILAGPCDIADAAGAHVGHGGGVDYVEPLMSAALTMYTTSWCGFCARLKYALKAEGIAWTEVDIEAEPEAAEFVGSV